MNERANKRPFHSNRSSSQTNTRIDEYKEYIPPESDSKVVFFCCLSSFSFRHPSAFKTHGSSILLLLLHFRCANEWKFLVVQISKKKKRVLKQFQEDDESLRKIFNNFYRKIVSLKTPSFKNLLSNPYFIFLILVF